MKEHRMLFGKSGKLPIVKGRLTLIFREIDGPEGGSFMSEKLNAVLTVAERIATVITIAVPALRGISSVLEDSQAEEDSDEEC